MKLKDILLACCLVSLSVPAVAQTVPDDVAKLIRQSFGEVSGYVTKSVELAPADKFTYQPTKEVRTFGQMVGHIIDGYNYFCSVGAGKKVEWSDAVEKGPTDKATLTAKLKAATSACDAAYAKGSVPFIKNNEHTNLHYGNLITYLRMMGLKPPSS